MILLLIVGIVSAIANGIREGSRHTHVNEDAKIEYLDNKYEALIGTQRGEWKVEDYGISAPYREGGDWEITLDLKKGTWPFDKEETEKIIYSDDNLNAQIK